MTKYNYNIAISIVLTYKRVIENGKCELKNNYENIDADR
ncbi:hypothetical protein IYC_05834 [Clostridium sporogenes PA 3679]|uniref:Uncharacterized protein n=1 Tax=Clostridium sporogenes TaxID=1509 RepID=A0A7U4LNI6_CLOSG|nr:hypothetical protein CLSPO_c24050 [Clostridium sporogenes]EHN16095.1 hypothetical protein IYC_05834 [Clostridium sporogenes PA 3679]STC80681.1 Uncharacterised protein [Clostridium botulinum]KCZ67812.1 hypothetical protein CSPO_7c01550 [Clostridium sporogenes]SQC03996.1 Uncharacterised protein [Clostridium sporogenes]